MPPVGRADVSQNRLGFAGRAGRAGSHEEHGRIPVAVSIVLRGFYEFFNLSLGQVLSAAKLIVRLPSRGNCSFLVVGVTSFRCVLVMVFAS